MSAGDRIIATMIELAQCTTLDRIILAGSAVPQRVSELHRRGYFRVMTTASGGLPQGQYDIGLIEWRMHSLEALDTTLNWFVHFLAPAGVLVIWVDATNRADHRRLRLMLERLGLRVEVGTRCDHGVAVSACRLDQGRLAVAA